MKSKWLIFAMLISLITGRNVDAKEINDDRIVHSAMKEAAEEVKNKYGLSFSGISEQSDHSNGKYEVIGVMFSSKKYIPKDEARKLIVDITKTLLNKLNTEKVMPFLTVNPFMENNIKITVYVDVPTKNWDYSQIWFFGNRRGDIHYTYQVPNDKYKIHQENESYSDALKILKQEQKASPQN